MTVDVRNYTLALAKKHAMLSGHSQLRTQPPAELDDDQDHTSEPEYEGAVVIPDIRAFIGSQFEEV